MLVAQWIVLIVFSVELILRLAATDKESVKAADVWHVFLLWFVFLLIFFAGGFSLILGSPVQ
jgi:uncharacterized membrane protein